MEGSAEPAPVKGGGSGQFLRRSACWILLLIGYFFAALFGRLSPDLWLLATGLMVGLVVLGLFKPVPSLGIGKLSSLLLMPLVLLVALATYSPALETYKVDSRIERLIRLRDTDQAAYGREINALRAELTPDDYMAQLKRIDAALYQEEYKRVAGEKVANAAAEAAAHAEALAQQKTDRATHLAELRKTDPKAYLKEIEGTSEWSAEFKTLDPEGYEAWKKTRAAEAAATANRPTGREYYDQSLDTQKIGWMQRGMTAVRAKLKDGDSAKFRDVFFVRGTDGIPLTCGEVNSKNSFGAYGGFQRFVSGGDAKLTFLEEEVSDFANVWNRFCS